MDYYLLNAHPQAEPFLIGTESYGNFWPDHGWDLLNMLINDVPNSIAHLVIRDERNNRYDVIEFLTKIKSLKLK